MMGIGDGIDTNIPVDFRRLIDGYGPHGTGLETYPTAGAFVFVNFDRYFYRSFS